MKTKDKKKCEGCPKMFRPKTLWQKYHTRKCRDAAFHRRRMDKIRKAEEIIRERAGL